MNGAAAKSGNNFNNSQRMWIPANNLVDPESGENRKLAWKLENESRGYARANSRQR